MKILGVDYFLQKTTKFYLTYSFKNVSELSNIVKLVEVVIYVGYDVKILTKDG